MTSYEPNMEQPLDFLGKVKRALWHLKQVDLFRISLPPTETMT